ncbi:GNAT family N-acetyltransferase [Arenibacter algicola]|uniref:Ribosomal-protein-alanine acetyltransferase n=1 Tax=Arenibacter algicola TaxID=616991 RepID=A0A221V2Z5_9FLAO|nr:GNAT family N-acetyltransferase [Arenibacter algicola]ASO07972.1 ribosomal-protein-alanine acetyltransferase [Arenibacter algicola]
MKEKIRILLYNLKDQLGEDFLKLDIEKYLNKLVSKAKIISIINQDKLEAFIAFYANDVNNEIGYITMLAVDQESQNKSLGKNLLNLTSSILKQQGFKFLDLEVNPNNAVAISLYESQGFKFIGAHDQQKMRKLL